MKTICVIPARGGSKRIPNKNIIDFNGLTLICHTVNSAIDSKIFDEIVVSTDDGSIIDAISDYSFENYIKIHERNLFADDITPVSEATIDCLQSTYNDYDIVVQLMPTCPLRTAKNIKDSFDNFWFNQHRFQISVTSYAWLSRLCARYIPLTSRGVEGGRLITS
jgi:CMP-N-acetylneuraminic acid synthetase